MSIGRKCISVFTLAAAIFAFSTFATAQETTTEKPDAVKKDGKRKHARQGRHGKRGMRGRHGKRGMRSRRGGRGMRGRRGGIRALRGITLNDSQKQQMQTLFQSRRDEMKKSRGQNQDLRKLMMAKRSGLATAAQEKQLADMHKQMMAKRKADMEKMNQSVRSILTPEQQAQFDKNIADRKKRMEGRKKRMEERKKMRMKRKVSQPKEVG